QKSGLAGAKPAGVFDAKGDVTYLIASNITPGTVHSVALEEIVGHRGLRGLLGDRIRPVYDRVWEQYRDSEELKRLSTEYGIDPHSESDRFRAVDEMIAHRARTGEDA